MLARAYIEKRGTVTGGLCKKETIMAATVWSGRITFGLVSIPVKLYTATTSHDLSFNLLHEKDKSRIKLQYYCPEDEKVVDRSELVKGYEYEKNEYVILDEDELDAIKPESSSNLDIQQFIQASEVDSIYFERTYYLGPSDESTEKTFALLATAMEKTGRAAVGKLLMREHEYLALIRPALGGLVLDLMHYEDEVKENQHRVRKNGKDFRQKELELAEQLIENLTEKFDSTKYKDEYQERLRQLIEAKIEGRKLRIVRPKKKPVVTDLLTALERSVRATQSGSRAQVGAGKKRKAS
jgi:DNA end-binding protein Ku